jgi:ABC-type phosphate transport system ATPase subunit
MAGPKVARQPDGPLQMFTFNTLSNRVDMLFEKPLLFSMMSYDNMPCGVHEELSRPQEGACVTCNMPQAACRADQDAVTNLGKMVEVGRPVRIFTVTNEQQAWKCAISCDGQLLAERALDV